GRFRQVAAGGEESVEEDREARPEHRERGGAEGAPRHRRRLLEEDHRGPSVQGEGRARGKEDHPPGDVREDQGQGHRAPGEVTGVFGELRRRGVLGALTAYGVAAAGALQLADIVVHNLDLPGWTVRALIWFAVAGFVATGVVSWFYDLTRRGFVRTQGPADRAPTPATPRGATLPTPQPPPVPRELGSGAVLAGRYSIERELGKGGMGRVLVARDQKLGRRVAVKVVTAAHDPARIRRFEQEARTAGALEHPNVLAVYDLGEQDGVPFLVTELLEGHTLRTVIDGPRLPPPQVQGLALQLARGLAAAHARGIVHRDLKPENLFLTDDGRLKVLDFGLARLTTDDDQGPGLTVTGAIFGTPGYLSPEQARGEKAGPPSDVFSAGAVIYELLS